MEKQKILLIEDDKALSDNILILLKESGYKVYSASNGAKGLESIKKYLPDLIICDVMMKGIDGYEVLNRVNQEENLQRIPFVFLTAKAEKDDIRRGMILGADDYIFKPFNSADLLSAIEIRLKKNKILTKKTVPAEQIENLPENKKKFDIEDKMFINLKNNPVFLKIKEIEIISASNQYSTVYIQNGKKIVLRKSIKSWDESLPKKTFLRIHRSTIINTDQIVKIEKWFNNSFRVYLKNIEKPFIISKRYSSEIRKI